MKEQAYKENGKKGLFDEQFGLAHLSEMGNCQVSP